VSSETPETPAFDVEMTIRITSPEGAVTESVLQRSDAELEVRVLNREQDVFDVNCLLPSAVGGATTFRVSARLPAQPEGTLVQISYRARDLFFANLVSLGELEPPFAEWVAHDETTATETTTTEAESAPAADNPAGTGDAG